MLSRNEIDKDVGKGVTYCKRLIVTLLIMSGCIDFVPVHLEETSR